MKPIFFLTELDFRKWLDKNHKVATELMVGYYKVNSGKPCMTWSQSVDQALCFGWIDWVRISIDADSYCIRFTPRRKNSIWSTVNIKKVEHLTREGLMKPEGLKPFGYRTEAKSGIYAFEKDAEVLVQECEQKFKQNDIAWAFFMQQPPSYRKGIIHWIMSAKQDKTRWSRIEKVMNESQNHNRIR